MSRKVVARSALSNARMVAGNEKRFTCVIDGDVLKEWVGFGWIVVRKATTADRRTYPRVSSNDE